MKKKSLIIALFIIILDQIIKILLDNLLNINESIKIINNFFYVTKVYNTGAAWSIFSNGTIFLIIIAILSFFFLLYYQKNFKDNLRNTIAFGLIYGGLLGNLIDRIIYGYVIDYLRFIIINYNFPIFNLADSVLVNGFVLLGYAIIKGEEKVDNRSKKQSR